MQNWTNTASNHNSIDAKQPHPQVAVATNQHNATSNTSPAQETVVPLAQPQTCTELTESDTELLAASELHNEFRYDTTMPTERPNHEETLVNELSCNDYEPTPTLQEFNDANMLSLEQWLIKTIPP